MVNLLSDVVKTHFVGVTGSIELLFHNAFFVGSMISMENFIKRNGDL